MSYQERLNKALQEAPARVTFNVQQKQYDWYKEATNKRCIR